jgi:hypothetical protein
MNVNTIASRALILAAIWLPVMIGPAEVFGISVFGIALFLSLFYVFWWSLSGSKWEAIKQEYRNLVRHREDGGLTSVTAAMFLLGAQMYLVTQVVWIISVINQFVIDPNWYQFCERAGYILMGGRPLQMGVQYAATNVRDLYKRKRRRRDDDDDETEPYDGAEFPDSEDLLQFERKPGSHIGKSGTSKPAPKPKPQKTNSVVVEDPRGIKGRWVLLRDGSKITLAEWQKRNGYASNQVAKYFRMDTDHHFARPDWILCELHFMMLDACREELGASWKIGSMYRHEGKSSTHEWGLAVDHQCGYIYDKNDPSKRTPDRRDGLKRVKVIQKVIQQLGLSARVSWLSYWENGTSIVHVDFGPMYFTPGTDQPFVKFRDKISAKAKASWHLASENLW